MEKSIKIIGKTNIDKLQPNKPNQRVISQNWDKKEIILDDNQQLPILNKLYLNIPFDGDKDVRKELERKIYGYKNQDIKKNIYDEETLITYDQLLEKLVKSKLRCYYCKTKLKLIYDSARDKKQWTLDRLNNDLNHSEENTIIADLKCNLERRCQDETKFLWGKQLKITKLD